MAYIKGILYCLLAIVVIAAASAFGVAAFMIFLVIGAIGLGIFVVGFVAFFIAEWIKDSKRQ